ncbi:MAG: hypothetical protein HY816_00920 [Candidatus Wallbacteria bacterium]|nr:hypothetical protein [Candidatus Wallbacteria bacterium]
MDLSTYRRRAQLYVSESNFERHRHMAGLKPTLDLAPLYAKYADVFAPEAIQELLILRREAAPDDEKRLRFLLSFAVDTAIDTTVRDEDEKLARVKSTATVQVGGSEMSFHSAAVKLANESDRGLRRQAYEARRKVIVETNGLRLERVKKLHERARELTGRSYTQLYQFLFKVDFELLGRQLENFLGASEGYYKSRLERFAQSHLGLSAPEIAVWDTNYLFRGSVYDKFFPEGRLLSILKRTLLGMGVDLKKLKNLTIDSADRPSKSPQAHCTPVSVPDKVYLLLRPQGGLTDCLSLFHEVGHALHYCFTSPKEEFEYKVLGDYAVTETYAFLFQYFTLNDDWCWDFLKIPAESDFLEFNQFRKLYLLRRYAAKFLFESKLHSGDCYDPDELEASYEKALESALHLPADPSAALYDLDDAFYGTHFLRAWIFEAELRQIINARFGKRWYSRPAAGEFLKSLWAFGHRYSVEELGQQVRLSELNMSPITQELR